MTRLNLGLKSTLAAIYLFLNAWAPAAAGAAENTQPPPPPARTAFAKPFLWKVEGPNPSWFFGTVHSDDPRVATLPPSVVKALDSSRSFHPELELNADLGLSLVARMFQADTPPLSRQLSPALWQRVVRAGTTLGLPDLVLERLTPAIAALLFSAPPATNVAATVDGQLYERAQQRGLKIAALETPDQQLAIFERLTRAHAVAALTDALDEVEAGRPNEKKLLAAYATGDERALAALIAAELNRSAAARALADPLLHARNRAMADHLVPHLRAGGAFVAIGAGHLIGPRSVIELLRERGWKVSRVAAP
ncbi:MAG: TraB/GumN family protein [Verrucomicrobia bacterium]|nr:TraB/GumN family protein [Verrucomicrobiota bacterium]